jgi:hypothetical protein
MSTHRLMPGRRALALFTGVALLLAACGGDDDTAADAGGAAAPTTTAATTTPPSEPPATAAPDTAPSTTPATTPASTVAPYVSEVYADPTHWVCRGDSVDVCDEPYPVTEVAADGSTTVRQNPPATDPPVDCFYVYPTISEDATLNSDLVAGSEIGVTTQQAALFDNVCTVYAPMYPSVTLAGLFDPNIEGDRATAWQTAYGGVEDAWRHYLANDNQGRGVILIGHSQGAGHLANLLRTVIDLDPAQRALLVSAYIIGSAIGVPSGADVGGDLQQIPLCRTVDATGCVVTYATFRATQGPPPDAFFGKPRSGEGVAGCVNPAAPAGGPGVLSSTISSADWALADRSLTPTTPFMDMPGLVTAECVERNGFSYLEITVNGDPADPRADDIQGDLSPQWGLHMVDIPLAGGSLLEMARAQIEAYGNSA